MKKLIALCTILSVLGSSAVLADPPAKKKTDAKKSAKVAKVTDLWVCPIQNEVIKDHKATTGKAVVVANRRIHFCCGGCPETFAKLSDKDKKAKVAAAEKTEKAAAKKAKS